MFLDVFEGVQDSVRTHAAQEADAAVSAQRADLDRVLRSSRPRQDFQMPPVEPADRDRREALANAALADLAQHLVLGLVDRFGPALQLGIALPETLVLPGGWHGAGSTPARHGRSPAPCRSGRLCTPPRRRGSRARRARAGRARAGPSRTAARRAAAL